MAAKRKNVLGSSAKGNSVKEAKAGTKKLPMLPLSRPVTPQDIIDRARQYGPACLESLAEVAASGTDSARVSAASALLDRGFGKPQQNVGIGGPEGGPVDVAVSVTPAIVAALARLGRQEDDVNADEDQEC